MGSYLPSTEKQQEEMLEAIGLKTMDELYAVVPKELILKECLDIPSGRSELEIKRTMTELSAKNIVFPTIFRGAGAYRHYIPAIVEAIVSKESLVTAYTPYQAEISQGILQSIFEYQTMICELTGMDVSNASIYDGASGAAEAVAMCRERKRDRALVSGAAPPDVIDTIRTYCWAAGTKLEIIPHSDGITDLSALESMLSEDVSCVYLQQPNYYGLLENCKNVGDIAHAVGAKFIMGINPIAAAILKTPRECGADIAVGEGQPLGIPLSFGGPYLGFMATIESMTRRLPGRIVGETTDLSGNRAFVLTLQAREQHIRREKAGSNVCSNQALCAMAAAAYMAVMGPKGMKEAATQSMSKAHYLSTELNKIGFPMRYQGAFFNEFITESPMNIDELLYYLEKNGILGGLPVDGGILWCATEMNTKDEIDMLIQFLSR